MSSINSHPEKASLTLWIKAQVDSLLLLVIWERQFEKERERVREAVY